jgi:branched-subunit amino acid transport protein AzlD
VYTCLHAFIISTLTRIAGYKNLFIADKQNPKRIAWVLTLLSAYVSIFFCGPAVYAIIASGFDPECVEVHACIDACMQIGTLHALSISDKHTHIHSYTFTCICTSIHVDMHVYVHTL